MGDGPDDVVRTTDRDAEPTAAPTEAPRPSRHVVLVRVLSIGGSLVILAAAGLQLLTRGTSNVAGLSAADQGARAQAASGPAPGFTLPLVPGSGEVSLRSLRGQVVVLNFWASWCVPCRLEAPVLEAASRAYASRRVSFLGVDEQDDRPSATAFQREFGITYPSAFDPSGTLVDDYGLIGLPTTLVISRDGRLLYRLLGRMDRETLTSTLDVVLGGASAPGT